MEIRELNNVKNSKLKYNQGWKIRDNSCVKVNMVD